MGIGFRVSMSRHSTQVMWGYQRDSGRVIPG